MKQYLTKKFEKGNSIYFECSFRAFDGSLKDPKGGVVKWKIQDSKGNVETGFALKRAEGIFYFVWKAEKTGDYVVEWTGEMPGGTSVVRRKFKVIQTRFK